MLFLLTAAFVNLETLSVPLPTSYVPYSATTGTSVATPAPTTYIPTVPTLTNSSVPETSAQTTSQTNQTGETRVVIPKLTNPSAPTPEEVLREIQASEGASASRIEVPRAFSPQRVSPVGAFDRVWVTPNVSGGSSSGSVAGGVPSTAANADFSALANFCKEGKVFTHTLRLGSRAEEVRRLQQFLNARGETRLADAGTGSKGEETDLFAEKTFTAVQKFQTLYAADILTPLNLTSPTGEWGARSIAKANQLVCSK